jgi:hypothetical protein
MKVKDWFAMRIGELGRRCGVGTHVLARSRRALNHYVEHAEQTRR